MLVVVANVAYLCYQAMREWQGSWRVLAQAPLVLLALWAVIISASKWVDPSSHSLWAFEVFAWAMITTIYLVTVMVAKRTFEKAEQQKQAGD
ncbi:MAG: hypothetical protein JKY98_05125 [Gammaproteobacteria bacterium]|nr:hypothetical protein [Gammaproteobacteria bacterium]